MQVQSRWHLTLGLSVDRWLSNDHIQAWGISFTWWCRRCGHRFTNSCSWSNRNPTKPTRLSYLTKYIAQRQEVINIFSVCFWWFSFVIWFEAVKSVENRRPKRESSETPTASNYVKEEREERLLSFLNNIVGIDVVNYDIVLTSTKLRLQSGRLAPGTLTT